MRRLFFFTIAVVVVARPLNAQIVVYQALQTRLGHAVFCDDAMKVASHGISHCGVDTHASGSADKDDCLHASSTELGFELRVIEARVAVLVHHDVVRVRLEFGDDLGVPGVADEDPTRLTARRLDCGADVHGDVLDPDRAVWVPGIAQIGTEGHLQIDDRHAGTASRVDQGARRLDDRLDRRYVDPGSFEHSSHAREVVLHVDDDDSGCPRINLHRRRPGVNEHITHESAD